MNAQQIMIRNKVKAFVDGRNITRYRFAQDCNLSFPTAYGLYDNPRQVPTSETLDAICRTYRVQPGDLLEYVDEEAEGDRANE